MWENRDVPRSYHYKAGGLFLIFFICYIGLCFYVMVIVKEHMVSIRFNYVYQPQCEDIKSMFSTAQ